MQHPFVFSRTVLALAAALSACATPSTPSPPAAVAAATSAKPLAAGASTPAAAAAPAASGAAPPAAAGAAPPPPLRPFADIIKDAKRDDGFLPVWRKDEKAWLEVPQERIGQPFLLSVNIATSVGERGLYASQMGPSWTAEFRRVGNLLQLIARNTDFRAHNQTGSQIAVSQAFPESLIAAGPVLSQPHPERKSVLVDAAMLIADLPGYSTVIERAFRLPYTLDKANSFFESSRADAGLTTLGVRAHFSTPRIPAPPLMPPPVPTPPPPATAPDARSFFVGLVVNLTALPEQPMRPRLADPRLGHFTDAFTDLGSDLKANPRVHYVNRWRLEKSDPSAALSEPKQPIVFWLDKNIPPRYREAVRAGVLEWNKAFERIGFKNAVQAKQQPDDANWDNMDSAHASVRWFVGADVGFAIGPNHSDPRTGEILDADIGMSDVFGRGARRFIVEDVGTNTSSEQRLAQLSQQWLQPQDKRLAQCSYGTQLAQEMNFALDLLEARGEIAPDSPEAEAFVQAAIKDVMMHEVGHTLGLKHNFKASTTVSRAQLQDKAYTETQGISGSVMDYNAYNIALAGERQGSYSNATLGAYDYWAIEYAYKPIAPADETAELARIAARSTEPSLAYADDADAGGGVSEGIDPQANRFDLGDDPLAYYRKRLQLSREVWQRAQDRTPRAGDDPIRQRRVVASGFRQLRNAAELVGKYVGGMNTVRDVPGAQARAAYTPVEPARQREALQLLARGFFSADSFRFRPELLTRLSPDYNEWDRGGPLNIAALVQQTQVIALNRLLAAGTAQRLLDLPLYVDDAQRRNTISLSEVYGTLNQTVWSELKSGGDIDRLRRNLQREHLKRVQTLLTKGSPTLPADALSLVRYHANQLRDDLQRASSRSGLAVDTKAHLQDSLSALTEALKASMSRN
jgi:Met-zincin/Domain of unknown function (DUF5117)/Domain of unknown function (DUF5118)